MFCPPHFILPPHNLLPIVQSRRQKSRQGTYWGSTGMYVLAFFREIVRLFINRYRPERHYMRGPGPKWVERHCRITVRTHRGG